MIAEYKPRPYPDPPDTRGHIGPYIDGEPLAVLGCSCDYCFRESINMHERRWSGKTVFDA